MASDYYYRSFPRNNITLRKLRFPRKTEIKIANYASTLVTVAKLYTMQ